MYQAGGILEGAEHISVGGFNRFIGPLYRLPDDPDGRTHFAFPVLDKHMNFIGTVHGGMLMALLDISMSRTSRLASGAKSCSTVSLDCEFLAAARLGDVVESRIRVARKTKTMAFMTGEISVGSDLIVTAQGIWRLVF